MTASLDACLAATSCNRLISSINSLCSWSTASMPTPYWLRHCNKVIDQPSAKDEIATLRSVVDNEHLPLSQLNDLAPFVIEARRPRRIPHAHGHLVPRGWQNDTLVSPRRTVPGYSARRQTRAKDIPPVDVQLDVD